MLVAVCGSNQRMHRQMIDDFVDNPRVRVLGFTDQMCAYMQASDLLISKAGGLTTAEAVASRTPLLYLNAVPGCESRNIGFMTGRGYALAVENDEELTPLLSGVISGAIDPTAMLRRREEFSPDILRCKDLSLNTASYELSGPTGSVVLPRLEYQLMELLIRNQGIYLSSADLLVKIWGYDTDAELGVVWVYISYLRKRLTAVGSSCAIRAKRNVGYTLEAKA